MQNNTNNKASSKAKKTVVEPFDREARIKELEEIERQKKWEENFLKSKKKNLDGLGE